MTDFLLPMVLGFLTGILSAWGVGGGTLLLLCMTLFLGVDQQTAQGINLLYFLPTAGMGLLQHRKNGLLDKHLLRTAIPWGLPFALAAAWLSTSLNTDILRKPFGIFLLLAGYITLKNTMKSSKK